MNQTQNQAVDEYIANYPTEIQKKLKKLRSVIHEAAPEAYETISYSMPAIRIHTILVYFAVFKNHIGFFPTPSAIRAFTKDLLPYKHSKGSIQFPLDQDIPYDLVTKIVKYRVKEDKAQNSSKHT
jgi:uncharacterized protein YdhG (YjbR/CyaY superfamily)